MSESTVIELLDRANAAYVAEAKTKDEVNAFKAELAALRARYIDRSFLSPLTPEIAKKKVMLAVPRYGPVERESDVAAFTSGLSSSNFNVTLIDKMGSALPSGFNQAWCDFANEPDFDYFALLHADCAPRGQWLDVLLEEMEKHQFDVIHAVVAIKDGRGITSTAIGNTDNQWAKARRITTTELQQLPETFTMQDYINLVDEVPEYPCMCCNTGVLLVKRNVWCRRFPGFRFQDRICATVDGQSYIPVDDPAWDGQGRLFNQFTPEDWDFGRWCYKQGLLVGATRKIIVDHIGRGVYSTEKAWGDWVKDNYFETSYVS